MKIHFSHCRESKRESKVKVVFLPSFFSSKAKDEGNRGFFPPTWFILFCLISGECWKPKCIVSSPMSTVLNICWALNTSAKQSNSLSTPPNPLPYTHSPLSITVNRLKGENNVLGMLGWRKTCQKFTSRRSFLLSAAA